MYIDYFGLDREVAALEEQAPLLQGAARLEALSVLVWYLRQRDSRRALALADEVQAQADAGDTAHRRALARQALARGECTGLYGKYESAAALIDGARQAFEALEDWTGICDCHLAEVDLCVRAAPARLEQALVAAVQASDRAGDRLRQAVARAGLSTWSDYLTPSVKVELATETVEDRDLQTHPGLAMCIAELNAHRAYRDQDFIRAAEHAHRFHDLALAAGQLARAISAADNAAYVFTSLGNHEAALEWCERALNLSRPTGWPMSTGAALHRMADCLRNLGRLEAAREVMAEATVLLAPYESSWLWAHACASSGDVLRDLGQAQEALRWYTEGEAAAGRALSPMLTTVCLSGQAAALSHLGQPGQAVAAATKALEMADKGGFGLVRANALHTYAQIAHAHHLPLPVGSQAPSAAVHYLEAALAQVGDMDCASQAEWLAELARAYEAAGDLVRAVDCERRAGAEREKRHAKKVANMTATMQMRHEIERAKAETLHHQQLATAEARRADAEAAANRAKSMFLASMSHELRSPLNAMLGFSRLLLRDPSLNEQARHDVSIVLSSGEQLYTLINQVLDLSKIEAGRVQLESVTFDVYGLLDELKEMFGLSTRRKGLELVVKAAPEVPRHLVADAVKLRQVLVNLLSNAVKFTARGRVELVAWVSAPQHLGFRVSDTGVGIATEELARLGQAFIQAEAGRRAAEGTGLGLAISRSFVALMGGQLHLDSEAGQGTTAYFEVPMQLAQAPAPVAEPLRRVAGLAADTPAQRILVVDDWPQSRQLLARTLQPLGFEVRECANGQEALDVWRQWAPQLVLMDLRMPVMDGREATRRIRAAEPVRQTRIVALTASSVEEAREEILALGCDEFMRKPFREDVLLAMIAQQLGVRYDYEEPALTGAGAAQPDAASMTALPASVRAELDGALAALDVQAVERAMDMVREHDPVLADTLASMVANFEYDELRRLIG